MKTIGFLGGMSWESTSEYYRLVNTLVRERLGNLHSARLVLYSVDFEEIEQLQHKNEWDKLTDIMIEGAQCVQSAGADCLLICTNTMHLMADAVSSAIDIPLIHIADATAKVAKAQNLRSVGLLGTLFTMEQTFYRSILENKYELAVLTPSKKDRSTVHQIIYEELCVGRVLESSKEKYLAIIQDLIDKGAQAIILGCTEIGLLVKQEDVLVPVLDTTVLHAEAAVNWCLENTEIKGDGH